MRAIVMREAGGPEALRLEEVPDPTAGVGQVLVRTEAIGVNFVDTRHRSGAVPARGPEPYVLGGEAVGVVSATGDGVDPALVGAMVAASAPRAYAEYVVAAVDDIVPVPERVAPTQAVAVGFPAATALTLLRTAGLAGHDSVLIEAAAGGVGGYLTQLVREQGVSRLIATAGSPAKRELAIELGADMAVDHTRPDWPDRVRDHLGGRGLDVVFESIGGSSARRLLDVLTLGSGRMLFYGMLSGEPPAIEPVELMYRGVGLIGCGGFPGQDGWYPRVMAARGEMLSRLAEGRVRPLLDTVLPLAEAAAAHRRLDDRLAAGRIVLVP